MSPARYIKLLRLEKAKQMLECSFPTLKEVTRAIGVEDLSHFARDYKAMFGETPGRTRRKNGDKKKIHSGRGRSNREPRGSSTNAAA